MKRLALLVIFLLIACAATVIAQEQQASKPTAEELEKQKEEQTKNAYRLLDQVIDESQSLRLPENRVRMQIYAADVLWDRDQGRARSMFMVAGDAVAEINRTPEKNPRPGPVWIPTMIQAGDAGHFVEFLHRPRLRASRGPSHPTLLHGFASA